MASQPITCAITLVKLYIFSHVFHNACNILEELLGHDFLSICKGFTAPKTHVSLKLSNSYLIIQYVYMLFDYMLFFSSL